MSLDRLLVASITFFSTMGGGILAATVRGRFAGLTAFAAGVLIAVPLFDLLPESINIAIGLGVPVASVMHVVALGFLFLYVLERYFSVHHICEDGVCKNVHHPRWGWIGASELSVHSFVDGVAIGLGFQFNLHVGIIVAVAVISHDFSDGINTVTVMLNAKNSVRSSLTMLLVDAITPLLGAASTLLFQIPNRDLVLILPFFAGGFLYLGASDLLPEAHQENPPLITMASCIAGFIVIFVVTHFLKI